MMEELRQKYNLPVIEAESKVEAPRLEAVEANAMAGGGPARAPRAMLRP